MKRFGERVQGMTIFIFVMSAIAGLLWGISTLISMLYSAIGGFIFFLGAIGIIVAFIWLISAMTPRM